MDVKKISTTYARMARSSDPKLFWVRPKSEFGKHLETHMPRAPSEKIDCMDDFWQ